VRAKRTAISWWADKSVTQTHILVVEDQRAVAGALRMRLRGLGYDVLAIAKDATEAIEKASTLRPDLILMDIRLGDGMDGIEAARTIRSKFDIPVVYVTAYADHDLLDRARTTQPAGFINKPYTTKDLLTAIDLALHQNPEPEHAAVVPKDRLREAVLTTDREGVISFLSSGAEQLTGWARATVIGQPLSGALTALYPLSHEAAQALIDGVLGGGDEQVLHRRDAPPNAAGDLLSALDDAHGNHFGVALRFDGSTVDSSFAALKRIVDSCRFALDQVPLGLVLVDRNLKIFHSNSHAQQIVAASPFTSLHGSYFRVGSSERHETLLQLVRRVAGRLPAHETRVAELIVLGCEEDDTPRLVAVATAEQIGDTMNGDPLVTLLLFDARDKRPLSGSVLEKMYGLTPSEVKVAQSLVGGGSLEKGAYELGISVNTARTHLKHIFCKTGAKRQSELIHQIETGPASLGIKVSDS
jgi:DNA-binding NarL/FixJ family response regulator